MFQKIMEREEKREARPDGVFGVTLQQVMDHQKAAYPNHKLPVILTMTAEGIVRAGGTEKVGLFRQRTIKI
jgi:hypothetical protein